MKNNNFYILKKLPKITNGKKWEIIGFVYGETIADAEKNALAQQIVPHHGFLEDYKVLWGVGGVVKLPKNVTA